MFGVRICGEPYAPTWSGRRLSMIRTRTFSWPSSPPPPSSSELQPAAGRMAAPAAPAAPACNNRRRLRRASTRPESSDGAKNGGRFADKEGVMSRIRLLFLLLALAAVFPTAAAAQGYPTGRLVDPAMIAPARERPSGPGGRVPGGLGEVRVRDPPDLADGALRASTRRPSIRRSPTRCSGSASSSTAWSPPTCSGRGGSAPATTSRPTRSGSSRASRASAGSASSRARACRRRSAATSTACSATSPAPCR